jgi:hypothetical protein
MRPHENGSTAFGLLTPSDTLGALQTRSELKRKRFSAFAQLNFVNLTLLQ